MIDLVLRPDGPASMNEKVDTMERLSEELLNNEGPVCKAMMNFRGALLFHTQRTSDALDCFRNVLQDDEENLNALLNCKYVCNKLLKESDVKKLKHK